MKVLFSDQDYPDLTIERSVFDEAGIELVVGKSALTEDALIAAAKGCSAILLQYAPITGRVLDALPGIGLVSRIGAGFDTVDTKACGERGVWVANSPDYGIGEVSTHALAMALSLIRHLDEDRPPRLRRRARDETAPDGIADEAITRTE